MKTEVERLISEGYGYDEIFKQLGILDNQPAKNYVYIIKHDMEKQSSTTIGQLH